MTNRNNDLRVGAAPMANTPAHGSLEWVSPTDQVPLPSKGKYYPEDHPLHNQEFVEMKYLTAREEDLLSDKKLLKRGVVIDKVLQSLIVDKTIKVSSLLIGDKNAMLVAARIGGYGSEYKAVISCPHCTVSSEYTFDLSELEVLYGSDVEISDEGTFTVQLPKTGFPVVCRLLTGADEEWLAKSTKMKEDKGLPTSDLLDQMLSFIVSVNGVTDQGEIRKFLGVMPAMDSKELRKVYKKTVPNVVMKQHFTCPECDASQEVDVPFGTEFFWPK